MIAVPIAEYENIKTATLDLSDISVGDVVKLHNVDFDTFLIYVNKHYANLTFEYNNAGTPAYLKYGVSCTCTTIA